MIVSETSNRVTSRWLQACVLLSAVVVLPFGIAYAQDIDAVEKRLIEAVSNDELSLEQAGAMMAALKSECEGKECGKKGCDGKDCRKGEHKGRSGDWHKAIGMRLKAAVAAGKLTEEEAKAKWAEIAEKSQHDDSLEGHYKRMGIDEETIKHIHVALNENGLNKRQVKGTLGGILRIIHAMSTVEGKYELDPRLHSYFKEEVDLNDEQIELVQGISRRIVHHLNGAREISKEHFAHIEGHLKEAVAAGKISEKDAHTRLEEMKKTMLERKDAGKAHWEGIKKRIEGAVERGDMTREQADAKYKEIREEMGKHRGRMHSHWEGIKKRIEGAVQRGDLTREEADAKYKEIKEKMSRESKPDKVDWEAVKRKIEGAVERGDLTREEADAKYEELKK